jgi:glycosyltransferase involved in cell wall biosynthesis
MKTGRTGAPLISVVTAVLNGREHIEQTILSVLNQSYDDIEYIVVDGGSTDGTLDIIRKYDDRIDRWISEPDAGIYDAMNKGIGLASGELINLLNADDYLEPDAVRKVAEAYGENAGPCIVYGDAYYQDDRYAVKAPYHSAMKPWLGMTVNHQAMFVHRDIYAQIGLYDATYALGGDYDFFVRCGKGGVKFVRVEAALSCCRNTGATFIHSRKSRREVNGINKTHYGFLTPRRMIFLLFNYIWMPFKLDARELMYRTIGVQAARKLIALCKKAAGRGRRSGR